MRRIYLYRAVVFLSAFLLFQIQPMVSKALLPGFGGSYLVWGACMVFCQAMLLIGYVYAHMVQRYMGVRRYAVLHMVVLVLPFVFYPFDFSRFEQPLPGHPLTVAVFFILLITISVPFVVLSTTSLVLQRWLADSSLEERENPYVLYAASNAGSILGLLSYPVLVEPLLDLEKQGQVWWAAYTVFAVLNMLCWPGRRWAREEHEESGSFSVKIAPSLMMRWLVLSLTASAAFLAVSNVLTFDVASVPFLWVLPLCVYLASFVLTFKKRCWFPEWTRKGLSWVIMLGIVLYLMSQLRLSIPPLPQVIIHLGILFIICINCTGYLVESKPVSDHSMTFFYLIVALGGLAGSVLITWVIPVVAPSLIEYPLVMVLVSISVMLSVKQSGDHRKPSWFGPVCACMVAIFLTLFPWLGHRFIPLEGDALMPVLILVVAVPVALTIRKAAESQTALFLTLLSVVVAGNFTEDLAAGAKGMWRHRNYYGIYKVFESNGIRYLQHGVTNHGSQYISGPKRNIPNAYFHPSTPAATVLRMWRDKFKNIGMVGLGTGALATYVGKGQVFTVFELDPDNLPIARKQFSYLDIAEKNGAELHFVFGDGRLSLRDLKPGSLNLLIMDAFNSGSIPVHLLTVEAIKEYLNVVGDNGLILMHVSNRSLNLIPVLKSNARAIGVPICENNNEGHVAEDAEMTYWVAISRNDKLVDELVDELGWWRSAVSEADLPRPWTDRYSNVLGAMFWF